MTEDPHSEQYLPAFRREVSEWFAANMPANWSQRIEQLDSTEYLAAMRDWLATLNSRGFGAPHVPREWGGGGYSVAQQAVIYEEWARAKAPAVTLFNVSLHHVPSTLLKAGTPEQRERYVRAAIGGVFWCQGFSEPDAGSDLASLRTRAVRDGDGYIVSGTKTWSSRAQWADYCLLLARTGPSIPKQEGISYFILDMRAPGVTVQPIRQSTGHSEFCDLFLEGVRIPAENLIGAEGEGWKIAQRTLSTERGPIGLDTIERIAVGLAELRDGLRSEGAASGPFEQYRNEIAKLTARVNAVRSLALMAIEETGGSASTVEWSSVIKIAFSELLRSVTDLGTKISVEDSVVMPERRYPSAYISGHWMTDFIGSWAWTIAGGTNEIQRNLVAERLLAMPREPRPA